jgi:regulatory protein
MRQYRIAAWESTKLKASFRFSPAVRFSMATTATEALAEPQRRLVLGIPVHVTADVLAAAARLLGSRPRSADEVRRRLCDAGYRDDLVKVTLARLTELGYLDDAAFARAWVESRDRTRPRGARALRDELRRKGIAAADAEAALAAREAGASGADPDDPRLMPGAGERAAVEASDDAAAARLLARKGVGLLREPDLRRRRAKAYGLLARGGFDPGTAGRASAAWLAQTGTLSADNDAEPATEP